jgi:hypothetical protein
MHDSLRHNIRGGPHRTNKLQLGEQGVQYGLEFSMDTLKFLFGGYGDSTSNQFWFIHQAQVI